MLVALTALSYMWCQKRQLRPAADDYHVHNASISKLGMCLLQNGLGSGEAGSCGGSLGANQHGCG